MTPDVSAIAAQERLKRRFLKRRFCGGCEAPISGDQCFAMYAKKCTKAEMADRRARALETYKPRVKALLEDTSHG